MTTKHHIIIGLAVGAVVGYFAYNTLASLPVYSQVASYASNFAIGS